MLIFLKKNKSSRGYSLEFFVVGDCRCDLGWIK